VDNRTLNRLSCSVAAVVLINRLSTVGYQERNEAMCQQWLSVFGLIADIIGFLMIAWEWRYMYKLDRSARTLEISEIRARYFARLDGRDRTDYEMDEDNASLPKHLEQALGYELNYRGRYFLWRCSASHLGFVGQCAGSLPGGIPGTSVQSCSTFGWAPANPRS
jgi:hypothetical protein